MDLGTRLVVVGTSGSGKTTIAVRLARALGVPHVELDALQHGRDWEQATDTQLRERAAGATTGDGWVVDGNYSAVRDVVWPRATAVIWLDYDRGVDCGTTTASARGSGSPPITPSAGPGAPTRTGACATRLSSTSDGCACTHL